MSVPIDVSTLILLLSNRFGVFRRGNAKLFLKLTGEMMNRGILQFGCDLGEVQIVFPDHLLALLELDPADVFAGGDLEVLVEESRQVAGAHIHFGGHHGHRQLLPDMGRDELLGLADNFITGGHKITPYIQEKMRLPQRK